MYTEHVYNIRINSFYYMKWRHLANRLPFEWLYAQIVCFFLTKFQFTRVRTGCTFCRICSGGGWVDTWPSLATPLGPRSLRRSIYYANHKHAALPRSLFCDIIGQTNFHQTLLTSESW